jgi:DNA repair protein RecO (recombination protein O)
MVEWTDDALVIGCRMHGEKNAVLEVMTSQQGRTNGLVRSGMSSTLRPLLQLGNSLRVTWRARLEEQLGTFNVEPLTIRTDRFLSAPNALYLLNVCSVHVRMLPERIPHPMVYEALQALCEKADQPDFCGASLVRFELLILQELGFGLDLSCCAATGLTDELIYVSPKSAQAVSASAGAPYHAKLLRLPSFLRDKALPQTHSSHLNMRPTQSEPDVFDGFALTGFFLERHVFGPRGLDMPDSRARLIKRWRG